jgi:hypothetical protein
MIDVVARSTSTTATAFRRGSRKSFGVSATLICIDRSVRERPHRVDTATSTSPSLMRARV